MPVVAGGCTSTCSPLAALKDVVYSTRLCNVDLFMYGMSILLLVVFDDSDFMVMISLSVAVLCNFDLMLLLLLLECLWKNAA